ncbi:MAG: hypothetical protein SVU32_05125 [Candidatus Nanohaloarchaea archaeon]|nr:hypothetical protein [Candidatus Nanohaloarchaea archaeon]
MGTDTIEQIVEDSSDLGAVKRKLENAGYEVTKMRSEENAEGLGASMEATYLLETSEDQESYGERYSLDTVMVGPPVRIVEYEVDELE